jgi:predicted GNAT family acetyltransferase
MISNHVSDQRSDADAKLDEALEETFPASDPPANTVVTGAEIDATRPAEIGTVTDNAAASRFELTVNGQTALLAYERRHDVLALVHTEVPPALRGQHLAGALVEAALQSARSAGLRIVAVCPFVRDYLRKHPAR